MNQAFEVILKLLGISMIRYFVIAGIPFFFCYKLSLKWLIRSKIQVKAATSFDFRRDILYSMQMLLVSAAMGYIIFNTPFRHLTRVYASLNDYSLWWIGVSLVLCLLIHDTYFYWMHRLLHHPKIFRYTHLLHHKSTNPSPWTSYSFHFLEACTESAVSIIIVLILPVHFLTLLLFIVVSFIINVYGHLGYEILPERFRKSMLFEIFNTSVYHNLHHSKFKGNYGLYLRFWDRLLHTEHPDYVKEYDRIQQNRFGSKARDVAVLHQGSHGE